MEQSRQKDVCGGQKSLANRRKFSVPFRTEPMSWRFSAGNETIMVSGMYRSGGWFHRLRRLSPSRETSYGAR
jgi:hypothetical protein